MDLNEMNTDKGSEFKWSIANLTVY